MVTDFFPCILFEGRMWFRNIDIDAGFPESDDLERVAQHGADFLYFIFVVGSKY